MFSLLSNNELIAETMQGYIERKLQPYGYPDYAFTVISKRNPLMIFIVSSYPDEWVELYRAGNFQHIDPVVLCALRRSSPFSWDDNITLIKNLKSSRIFSLSRKYNIVNGLTFVLHDPFNNMALLSLIIDSDAREGHEDKIMQNRAALQMVLIETHEQLHQLLSSYERNIPGSRGKLLNCKPLFTTRENEILWWASMGKSYADIGVILGIAVRTVKFHMANVVRKLGVNNARQAIRLGVELELIKPSLS